jgi:hypothetical protein
MIHLSKICFLLLKKIAPGKINQEHPCFTAKRHKTGLILIINFIRISPYN